MQKGISIFSWKKREQENAKGNVDTLRPSADSTAIDLKNFIWFVMKAKPCNAGEIINQIK